MRKFARVVASLLVFQLFSAAVAWACDCVWLPAEEIVTGPGTLVVGTVVAVDMYETTVVRNAGSRRGCGAADVADDGAPQDVGRDTGDAVGVMRVDVTEVVVGKVKRGQLSVRFTCTGEPGSCGLCPVVGEQFLFGVGGRELWANNCSTRRLSGPDDPWLVEVRAAAAAAARQVTLDVDRDWDVWSAVEAQPGQETTALECRPLAEQGSARP